MQMPQSPVTSLRMTLKRLLVGGVGMVVLVVVLVVVVEVGVEEAAELERDGEGVDG